MALIQCSECNAEISDQAQSCPKCGAPTLAAKAAAKRKTPWLSVAALGLAVISLFSPYIFATIIVPVAVLLTVAALYYRQWVGGIASLVFVCLGGVFLYVQHQEIEKNVEQAQAAATQMQQAGEQFQAQMAAAQKKLQQSIPSTPSNQPVDAGIAAAPVSSPATIQTVPDDVRAFITRHEKCDPVYNEHPDLTQKSPDEWIKRYQAACEDLDQVNFSLSEKYKNDPAILATIERYPLVEAHE
jgi:ribosomal protein L40E